MYRVDDFDGRSNDVLRQLTHDLGERVKELNCLYLISQIVENQSNALPDILQQTVDILPPAWQYPEITCSRIVLGETIYKTKNFSITRWKQSQPITLHGVPSGQLEIYYLAERPDKVEGPFLQEERNLINVIAERIGQIVERKEALDGLQESEARNRALLDAIPDLIFRVSRDASIIAFHEGSFTALAGLADELTGKKLTYLTDEKKLIPRRVIEQGMTYVRLALDTGRSQLFEQHISVNGHARDFEIRIVASGRDEALGIIRDITSQKRLEKEIIEISGREQRRIGQDLHDSLCQQLTGIGFLCKALQRKREASQVVGGDELAEVVRHLEAAITHTREYARGLNPVRLETNGLANALSELAETAQRFFKISCRFACSGRVAMEDNARATHVYRIVQEAINNAIKHGRADTITIGLCVSRQEHVLTVRDNGGGMRDALSRSKGMGLSIMQYRASMIGGTLTVENHPDGGVMITCVFPCKLIREESRDDG